MKNLIDKYQEQILDLGVGYFDLSGQVNNDRIILNLYKSEFKNCLSVNVVMNLNSQEISTFGKGGFDLNVKKIINDKLVLCDGTEYQFVGMRNYNLSAELEVVEEDVEYKIKYYNSNIEEYYHIDNPDATNKTYSLVRTRDKKKEEDIHIYTYVNGKLDKVTNRLYFEKINNVKFYQSEIIYYTYNSNNTCRYIDIYRGDTLLKGIAIEYDENNHINSIIIRKCEQSILKVQKQYEVIKTAGILSFRDCLTELSKSFVTSLTNGLIITDEFGLFTNIENGVVKPYFNKLNDEELEKRKLTFNYDKYHRLCDIEGYNKMHSIRKYQGNKLLLRCDGCFKDVNYLGEFLKYVSTTEQNVTKLEVNAVNKNYISGINYVSLFKMEKKQGALLNLDYNLERNKVYTVIVIGENLEGLKLRIKTLSIDTNEYEYDESYEMSDNYFAYSFNVLESSNNTSVDIYYDDEDTNENATFNAFVIQKGICNVYKYNEYGQMLYKIENGKVVYLTGDLSTQTHILTDNGFIKMDKRGNVESITSETSKTFMSYNENDQMDSKSLKIGDEWVVEEEYDFDSQNRLIKKTTSLNNTPSIYEYNDYTVSKVRTGQDEVEYVNEENRPLLSKINYRKVSENNNTLLKSHGFNYGNDYLVSSLTENDANKYQYTYDSYKRLISVRLQGQLIEEYSYNETFPHLLSTKVVNGVQEQYTYDTFENLIGLKRGNDQFVFTYDGDNLLTTITLNNQVIATYEYEYGKLISSTKNGVTERYIYNEEDKIVDSVVAVNNTSSSVRYESLKTNDDNLSKLYKDIVNEDERVYLGACIPGIINVKKIENGEIVEEELDVTASMRSKNGNRIDNNEVTTDISNEDEKWLPFIEVKDERGIEYYWETLDVETITYSTLVRFKTYNISLFTLVTSAFNDNYTFKVNSTGDLEIYEHLTKKYTLNLNLSLNKFYMITFTLKNKRLNIYLDGEEVLTFNPVLNDDNSGIEGIFYYGSTDYSLDVAFNIYASSIVFSKDKIKGIYYRFEKILDKITSTTFTKNTIVDEQVTTIEENITLDEITFSNTNISRNGLKPVLEYREILNNKDCAYEYDKDLKCFCLNKMGLVYDLGIKENGTISFNLKTDTNDSTILIVKEKQDTLFKLYKENNKLYAETKGWSRHEISLDASNYHNCVIQINTSIVDDETKVFDFSLYLDGALKCMQGFEEENTYLSDNLLFRFNMDESYNIGSNKISSLKYSNNILTSSQINKDKFKVINKYSTTGLLQEKSFLKNNNHEFVKEYRYNSKFQVYLEQSPVGDYQYGYDDKNNLTYHTGTQYQYDDRNRLVKEIKDNQTIEYRYDVRDNITHIIKNGTCIYSYSYDNKDRLVMTNGVNVTYPNTSSLYPTHIDTRNFALDLTWQGNKLYTCSRTQNNSQVGLLRFTYNHKGLRKTKYNIQRGITHTYTYDEQDRLIVEQRSDGKTLRYYYDINNMLCAFSLNNVMYFYERDAFGNINHLIDKDGNIVVSYSCKAYGQDMTCVDNTSFGLGDINPFRYKGYYYDVETQLFYCKSRYYSPELCRWISPDSIEYLDPESINGLNLYAYCGNNPVNYKQRPVSSGSSIIISSILSGGLVGNKISGNAVQQIENTLSSKSSGFNLFGYELRTSTGWDTSPDIATSFFGRIGFSSYVTHTQGQSGMLYAFAGSTSDVMNRFGTTYYAGVGINLFDIVGVEAYLETIGIGAQVSIGRLRFGADINLIGATSITIGCNTDLGNGMTRTDGFTVGVNTGCLVAVILWICKFLTTGDPSPVPGLQPAY